VKRIPAVLAIVALFAAVGVGPVLAWRYRAQHAPQPVTQESHELITVTITQGDRTWQGEVRRVER
jgi:hypothetical protein